MRINTKSIVQDFPIPNDPDKGALTLQFIPPDEREGMGVSSSLQMTRGGETRVLVEPHAGDARFTLAVRSIKAWKNIYDESGNELPCTDRNKAMFARHAIIAGEDGDMSVLAFIGRCQAEMQEKLKPAQENARKN